MYIMKTKPFLSKIWTAKENYSKILFNANIFFCRQKHDRKKLKFVKHLICWFYFNMNQIIFLNLSNNYFVFMTIPQYPQRTRQYLSQKLNSTFRLLFMFNRCIDWEGGLVPRPPHPLEKGFSE